jgi:hypothetical protein
MHAMNVALFNAVKELQQMIVKQNERIDELERELATRQPGNHAIGSLTNTCK